VALAVTVDGTRDILGLWAGDGGEGAKYWLQVLTEIKNRGVADVCMVVCDGLKGLPDAIETVWPQAVTQTCVVHLMRASFRYAARQDWDRISRALKPIYTAPTAKAAEDRFLEFQEEWGDKYPAIVRLWENAWAEFVPFLQFDAEIRKVICSTNAIVIWSRPKGVHHVEHGPVAARSGRRGCGYLPPSMTRIGWRNGAGATGGVARFGAGVVDGAGGRRCSGGAGRALSGVFERH
jgi:hypothetical protein